MFFCTQATQNLTIWMSADHNSHPNPAPQENLSAPRAPPHPGVAPCACSIPLTWCTEHPDQIVQFCGLFLQKRLCMCSECLGSNSSYDLFCSCHVLLCSAALNLECPWSCDVHVSCVVASLLQCPCLWDLGPPPTHPKLTTSQEMRKLLRWECCAFVIWTWVLAIPCCLAFCWVHTGCKRHVSNVLMLSALFGFVLRDARHEVHTFLWRLGMTDAARRAELHWSVV